MSAPAILRHPRTIPTLVRGAIIERYNRTCQYCGGTSESLYRGPDGAAWEIDHKVPYSKGGSSDEANLTLSCGRCNRTKAATLPGTRTTWDAIWAALVRICDQTGKPSRITPIADACGCSWTTVQQHLRLAERSGTVRSSGFPVVFEPTARGPRGLVAP